MPFQKGGSPFLYDDTTRDIIGVRDLDGREAYFALSRTAARAGRAAAAEPPQQLGPLSMELAPAADVPTITYPASSGYGGSAISNTDSRFTYWGGVSIVPDTDNGFGQLKSLSSSSVYVAGQPFFSEYGFDGTTLTIRMGCDATKTEWHLWVDGKLASTTTEPYEATTGTIDLTMVFAAARPRIITTLGSWGAHKYTAGAATDTIWGVTRSKGRRVALIADSWGNSRDSEFMTGCMYRLALSLGYSDIMPSMQGGTGYYNPGPINQGRRCFADRFDDELGGQDCTDYIVLGSINDLPSALSGVARADVKVKMAELFSKIYTESPNARVFVCGPQYVNPSLTANYAALEAELQEVLTGRFPKAVYVSSAGWLTGTGKVGTLAGSGNRDIYRASDGDHTSSPEGDIYWALRMRSALCAAGDF